ncbi:MAG: M14 family metallopeptidase [Blastocatellia bacterium]|nr:M14 family metallopeptidase [Blastocatellia bacterium]
MRRKTTGLLLSTLLIIAFSTASATAQVTSPKEFLGFTPGDDYKLANYKQSFAYFKKIAAETKRMKLFEVGKSAMGETMTVAVISSEENLARLDRLKEIARRLSEGRGLTDAEARALAKEGRAVVWIDGGMHATEVGHAQHMINLGYDMVTRDTEEYRKIRDRVVLLLIPSINPDGQNMVADWFNSHYGTPREGTPLPWLYQKYAGHDNNRDWFMLNLPETRNMTRLLYHEYFPQIVYNHHQTAPFPARIFVPPNVDPMNPNIPPLVMRGLHLVGAAMHARFEAEGKSGVISQATFSSWWNGGMRTTPYFHNIIGILTETAHASPYPANYKLEPKDMEATTWYPNPYRGGKWHFRDTLDYMNTASLGVLNIAADLSETFQYNMYLMAKWAIEKGEAEAPYGFIFPLDRRDPNTVADFLERMLLGGLEVHLAKSPFTYDGVTYPAGTPVMLAAQSYRPHLMDMVMPQNHPMRLQYPEGPPIRPYDIAGWTLTQQMGVTTIAIKTKPSADLLGKLEKTSSITPPAASVAGRAGARGAYLLPGDRNIAVTATNRLLAEGHNVYWLKEDAVIGGKNYAAGTVIVPAGQAVHEAVSRVVNELRIPAAAVESLGAAKTLKLKKLRVGTYDPYGGSMPQGWTHYILEKFGFDHVPVINPDIRDGNLKSKVDVLILNTFPNLEDRRAAGGRRGPQGGLGRGFLGGPTPRELAPEVAARLKGIGEEGLKTLAAFVREGGVLISTESANERVMNMFRLPIREVTRGTKFYSPGSVFKVYVDPTHPFGWGMPAEARVLFDNGHAWEADVSFPSVSQGGAFARYPEDNPMVSGWIIADEVIRNRAAAVEYHVGRGRVALFGFDVIFRGQPHLGFKMLFNAILTGAAESDDLK